ncbi:RICIN domain-containing protein [Streptococcus equinus]|uniref:pectate lyase family protein n=1 Tax=Streptococcus equinus TaxID=1335 RepID=UPI003C700E17
MRKLTRRLSSALSSFILVMAALFSGLGPVIVNADTTSGSSWNFEGASFKDLGTITDAVTIDGLTLLATKEKPLEIKPKVVTVDGSDYSYALTLPAQGSKETQSAQVPVSGECTIKVTLQNASDNEQANLAIADSQGQELTSLAAKSTASTESYAYSGGADNLYLYSKDSDIDVFKIELESTDESTTEASTTVNTSDLLGNQEDDSWLEESKVATGQIADGWYYIKNINSQKYLEVTDGKDANGANVQQFSGNGYPCQKWYVKNVGNGYITLKTGMASGRMLDVANGGTSDGTNIQIYDANGLDPQKFLPVKTDQSGVFCLQTKCSGNKQALDVYDWSTADKGNIDTWTYNGLACQQFRFEAINEDSNSQDSQSAGKHSPLGNVYPEQQLQFVNTQDGNYLNDTGKNGAALTSVKSSGVSNRWILSYVNNGIYRIVNSDTGFCLTPYSSKASAGAGVAGATVSSGDKSQYWQIVATKKDAYGTALNYKIVNNSNTNLALTLSNNSYRLEQYNGSAAQNFRVNSYGVEGFAGYSKDMSNREKACVTGGVFGKVVTVKSLKDLQNYAAGSTPYTIIIGANLSQNALTKVNVGSNKTFVGSYQANTLNNIHFRNIQASGNNIYKNITFTHSVTINNNDDIQMYISDGNNFWLDHCSWPGHDMNRDANIHHNDTDKFLYVGLKANFVSVNGCFFGGHKYGLILGYPQEDGKNTYRGYPCMTISNNYFRQTLTRAPGLMRYGYFHCYNNYVSDFDLGYTPYTECNIYSEKNVFEAGSHKGCVVNGMNNIGRFTDNGSILSWDISTAKIAGGTSWRPSGNYGYATRSPQDAKNWVVKYAGVHNSSLVYPIN